MKADIIRPVIPDPTFELHGITRQEWFDIKLALAKAIDDSATDATKERMHVLYKYMCDRQREWTDHGQFP